MALPNENDNHPKENNHALPTIQPEVEHSEGNQVLETMIHLIGEKQIFKAKNEQLKKAQERKHEFNEICYKAYMRKTMEKINEQRRNRYMEEMLKEMAVP